MSNTVATTIEQLNNTFAQAFNTADYEVIASLYAQDATFIPATPYDTLLSNEKGVTQQGRAWIQGNSAIAAFFRAFNNAKQQPRELKFSTESLVEYANGDVQCLTVAILGDEKVGYNSIYYKKHGNTYLIQNDVMSVQ